MGSMGVTVFSTAFHFYLWSSHIYLVGSGCLFELLSFAATLEPQV